MAEDQLRGHINMPTSTQIPSGTTEKSSTVSPFFFFFSAEAVYFFTGGGGGVVDVLYFFFFSKKSSFYQNANGETETNRLNYTLCFMRVEPPELSRVTVA